MPTPTRQKQLPPFAKPATPTRREHGGEIRRGRRKEARPFDPNRALHLVLRSSRAQGTWSFLHPKHRFRIEACLKLQSRRFGIRVYRDANSGNHLHLLIKAGSRESLQGFLRALAGQIAMLITKSRKGTPVGRFWDTLAYSRIVEWGKDFRRVTDYVILNLLEGLTGKSRKRGDRLMRLRSDRSPVPLEDDP